MTQSQQQLAETITPILARYGVTRAALFGSVARDEATPGSDLDLLVEVRQDTGLLAFIQLKHELEDHLGRRVDLVEYDALKPEVRAGALRDQVVIL